MIATTILVLHINAYSDKLIGGYLASRHWEEDDCDTPRGPVPRRHEVVAKIGSNLTRAEVLDVLASNPDMPCKVMRV